MSKRHATTAKMLLLPAIAVTAAVVSGATAGASQGRASSTAKVSPIVAQAKAEALAASTWPSTWKGPTTPTTPQVGKKVVVISCSQATACALEVAGVVQAAKVIGWKTQVVDGKGDAGVTASAIRNAVVGGANAIILASVNVGSVTSALQFAKAHHVPVLNNASNTAAQEGINPTLVAGNNPDPDAQRGRITADWMIWNSGGKAQVMLFRTDDAGLNARDAATVARLKQCSGCKILEQNFAGFAVTTTPAMSQAVSSVLQRFPNVGYIRTPYSAADVFAESALQSRGAKKVQLISDSPTSLQMQQCYQGKSIGAVYGDDLTWVGWEAVDEMNRILQHPGVTPPAENTQWVLRLSPSKQFWPAGQTPPAAASCPASGNFNAGNPVNYQAKYKALWGLK
ncbi:MAG: sugar transporter substrate-binding protein [Acidimicrobiaceae bacterium]|nr:sugar transporter substrate-binding protein [Acidimicrobiaceae bacterium]